MSRTPLKGHAALRVGRDSVAGADYFLTLCTENQRPGLTSEVLATAIQSEARAMEADSTWRLRCLTIMPDHVHVLITLGDRLPLGKAVSRLKSKTSTLLKSAGLSWERGFFDRRLRPDDERTPIFLYLYLNPYRAALVERDQIWPWFHCSAEDWTWFQSHLTDTLPPPAWL